jgi:hypothetical protein
VARHGAVARKRVHLMGEGATRRSPRDDGHSGPEGPLRPLEGGFICLTGGNEGRLGVCVSSVRTILEAEVRLAQLEHSMATSTKMLNSTAPVRPTS